MTTMTITDKEFRDLLSFFSAKSSVHNIISLSLTQPNSTVDDATIITTQTPTTNTLITKFLNINNDFDNIKNNNVISDKNFNDNNASEQKFLLSASNDIDLADVFGVNSTDENTILSTENTSIINETLSRVTIALNGNQSGPIIPRISSEMPIWLIPCYSIILLFAIVGNLLVISTLVQNRRMRTITNLFLLNLAISDILLGVLCMPVTLTGTLLRHFIFGEFFCKLIQFSQATSVAVSSWTLVAISCERYYAICHPLRSRTWQTINHAYKIIGFIWFGSMVCMTPIAVFSRLMSTSRQGLRKCREYWPEYAEGYERSYNLFLDLILLVLPLLILCVAYILITRTLYVGMKNERAMIFGGASSTTNKTNTLVDDVSTVTTTLMPSSGFNLNMSFRCQKQRNSNTNGFTNGNGGGSTNGSGRRRSGGNIINAHNECEMIVSGVNNNSQCSAGNGNGNGNGNGSSSGSGMQQSLRKQNWHKTQQQYQQHQQQLQCFVNYVDKNHKNEDTISHTGSKRKLLTATDGRRHLYCMRSSSVKSLNQTENTSNHNGMGNTSTSPSPSMTVINMPQQQRFQLHQQRQKHHDSERRKSNSTPSLRITDAALRRSNETKNLESKKRVVKMLFVLVLEFFICWTPLYVINTVAIFIGPAIYEYIDYTSISFFQLLAYSSSCCNPITYCFMNAGFRRAFLDTFKGMHLSGEKIWKKKQKIRTNLSVAGNSIALANSATIMSTNTMLDSPRL